MQGTGAVIQEALGLGDEEIKRLAAEVIAEKEKPTQAQLLLDLTQDAELLHAPNGDCYASVRVGLHLETWPINAKGFRRWLVRRFYEAEGKPPRRSGPA